jgi:serine/alanine adding enzyme
MASRLSTRSDPLPTPSTTLGETARDWDSFVRRQRGWTHFHLFGWKDIIERNFGHECIYLEDRDATGALGGVLPLVRLKSLLFGHFLVSMPFVNYGGPLGTATSVRRLTQRAVTLSADSGARLLELRSRVPLDLPLPVSHRKVTVVLDLPHGDPDVLWRRIPAKVRSQIRRPQKEGASARFGPDEVGPFHDVFTRNMRDLGTPTLPRRLFETILDMFPGVTVGCIYLSGKPVAAGYGFRWGDELEMTWASSIREFNRVAPNMLLYWSFMERAIMDGATLFNFGRCTPGGGTHRFKLQWGGRDDPLWWYRSSDRDGDVTTPTPESRGAYALGSRLWSHLPLAIANLLGPRIIRFIP